MIELTGSDLTGAKLDAAIWFPAQIKQTLTEWRAASSASINGHDVQMIQGTADGRHPVNLYFDSKSGLLSRVVRYSESPVGLNPTQIDYADYRDGGRSTYALPSDGCLAGRYVHHGFSPDPAQRADRRREIPEAGTEVDRRINLKLGPQSDDR